MTTPPRPDQEIAPPPAVLAPGGSSGIFRGRLVVVNGQVPPAGGIFLYNASGQLVGSWVSLAGTDPLDGASVNIGITVQNGTTPSISNSIQSGGIVIEKFSGVLAPPSISLIDDTAVAPLGNLQLTTSGILFDGWHTLSLAAGWSTVGGQPVPSYKLLPDGVNVQLTGVATHAGFSANTQLSTAGALPAAYQPATLQVVGGQIQGDAAAEISTTGTVTATPGTLASATVCRFNGTYPIDL